MNFKKMLGLLLSAAMATSILATPALAAGGDTPLSAPQAHAPFTDTANHWVAKAIDRWAQYGIIKGGGDGRFDPDGNLTRAAMATMLSNLLGLTTQSENIYEDVKTDAWYASAVLQCTAAGIMKGNGSYARPGDYISRQESMVMIARALGLKPADKADLSAFQDGGTVAPWAASYLTTMVDKKILSGVGVGLLAPNAPMSRAAVVTILDKAISTYVNQPGTYPSENRGMTVVAVPDVTLHGSEIGELLIAQGAGTGDVTLNVAHFAGLLIARGGTITGSGESIGSVQVDSDALVTFQSGQIAQMTITAEGAKVTVGGSSQVQSLSITQAGTAVTNFGQIEALHIGAMATAAQYIAGPKSRMPKIVTEQGGHLTLTTVEEQQRLASMKPAVVPPHGGKVQELNELLSFTSYFAEGNYTEKSWAPMAAARAMPETTLPEQEAKLTALKSAVDSLVLIPSAQNGIDRLTSKMKRYFEGQNDSATHAITLHLDTQTQKLGVCVFQPDLLLMLAMQGSGMKSAFTEAPVLHITTQDGTHVPLITPNGERDAIGAAMGLAQAIGTRYGVDAYDSKLSDILAQSETLRDMQVLFSCGSSQEYSAPTEYSGIYTLNFYQSPLRLQETAYTLAPKTALQLRPIAQLTDKLTWKSSNTSVAKVDENGVVTALRNGTATISMGMEGYTGFPAQTLITVAS